MARAKTEKASRLVSTTLSVFNLNPHIPVYTRTSFIMAQLFPFWEETPQFPSWEGLGVGPLVAKSH